MTFQENITCYPQAWQSIRVFSLRCLSRVHTLFILPTTKASLNLKWRHVQFMLFRRIMHGPKQMKICKRPWPLNLLCLEKRLIEKSYWVVSCDHEMHLGIHRPLLRLREYLLHILHYKMYSSIAPCMFNNLSSIQLYLCTCSIRWNDGILSLFLR